jgi:DNA-binding NarL/FixJ family response regulator
VRPRILLVDDHEIVRKGIRELLEGPTREVCGEAGTGEEALQKVQELKPDIVVMDYLMPGMSGLETLQKIREVAPSIKVVILTMDDAVEEPAIKAGADACVQKGSVVGELHQTITRLLIGRSLSDGW